MRPRNVFVLLPALWAAVSMLLAAALAQTNGNLTQIALIALVPTLLVSYISSRQAAGRLEDTSRHLVELRRLYDSTIETLAMAIDAKDQVTHGHIRRVQLLSGRLARQLGAEGPEVQALAAAALLHDLGKLAVPEYILNKPGPLTEAEYAEMKKHADVGASILSAIEFPFPVVPIVRHHHENWDGTGYPDGLQGAAIPLGARILAVVDCYDALTSDRPYRRRLTPEEALEIIRSRSGRMYDPAVVAAFVQIHSVEDTAGPHESEADAPLPVRAVGPVASASPVIQMAAPVRHTRSRRERVAQFLATLDGSDWKDGGGAVAAFIPVVLPEAVGALFQFDAKTNQLVAAGMNPAFDPRLPHTIPMGRGVTGWVATNKQPMINTDAELDLGDVAGIVHPPLRLCASFPLLVRGDVAGVLTVYSPYAFGETERMIVERLAQDLPAALRAPEIPAILPPTIPGAAHIH